MKVLALFGLIISVLFASGSKPENNDFKTKFQFASIGKAKELLSTEDQFTKSWSQFDIDSRLRKVNGKKEDLFKYIASQSREWTQDEKTKINSILDTIYKSINTCGFKINLPKEIYFVKTTTEEEGGAEGYTRANYIVLKEAILSKSESDLRTIVIHELFHVLSRNDNNFRRKMYKIIGFEITNEIDYPESIRKLRITNPDAPGTDSYIVLKKDDKPVECTMILYAKSEYDGGDFFRYLTVGFLKLQGTDKKEADYVDRLPVIYSYKDVSGFYDQVGRNTQYIIHPEEVLADNFVFAIYNKKDLNSQWLVDKIQEMLR